MVWGCGPATGTGKIWFLEAGSLELLRGFGDEKGMLGMNVQGTEAVARWKKRCSGLVCLTSGSLAGVFGQERCWPGPFRELKLALPSWNLHFRVEPRSTFDFGRWRRLWGLRLAR